MSTPNQRPRDEELEKILKSMLAEFSIDNVHEYVQGQEIVDEALVAIKHREAEARMDELEGVKEHHDSVPIPWEFGTGPYRVIMSKDPTAIPIEFDPQKQRMVGVARHGMTPFDVPFISHIHKYLWQGGCQNGLVLPEFIDVVVSLYPWEKYTINHDAERIEVEMYDSLEQSLEQVDELASLVNKYRDQGKNVLVHCQAGLNRSSLVAARALMLSEGYSGEQAIAELREKRSPACLCNPAFEKHLRSLL